MFVEHDYQLEGFDFPVCTCHNTPGGVTIKLRLVHVMDWNPGFPTAEINGLDDENSTVNITVHKDTPEWRKYIGRHPFGN